MRKRKIFPQENERVCPWRSDGALFLCPEDARCADLGLTTDNIERTQRNELCSARVWRPLCWPVACSPARDAWVAAACLVVAAAAAAATATPATAAAAAACSDACS